MIKKDSRKLIRQNARNIFKMNFNDIVMFTITISLFCTICFLLSSSFLILSTPLTAFCTFTIISVNIFNLKLVRGEKVFLSDILAPYTSHRRLMYFFAWIIKSVLDFILMTPFGILIYWFFNATKEQISSFYLEKIAIDAFIQEFERIISSILHEFSIFLLIFIIIYINVYLMSIFLKFIMFAVHDADDDTSIFNIYISTYKMLRGNRISFIFMIMHFNILNAILGLGLIFATNLTYTISSLTIGLAVVFGIACIVLKYIVECYYNLSIAGFYDLLNENEKIKNSK